MATRALIGYLNSDNTITTTYNHYDGYPENLGKALDRHYDTDERAKEIANMGYVSFVEPVNGDIEANNKSAPITVGDEDLISSLQYFKEQADGTDYAYLYIPGLGDWVVSPTFVRMEVFVDTFIDAMESTVEEFDEDEYESDITNDTMDESYQSKWKKFINEDDSDETDMIFDYADRLLGAGVEDFEALADFYADNPDEVPEPMDAGFFLKYKDEIVNAANDQYRYDSSDAGME